MKTDQATIQPARRNYEDCSFAMRLREALNIAVLCVVAALLLGAATFFLLVYSVWPALAPVRAREPWSGRRRLSGRSEAARTFLAKPIEAMRPLDPPKISNIDSTARAHEEVERRAKQQEVGGRYG